MPVAAFFRHMAQEAVLSAGKKTVHKNADTICLWCFLKQILPDYMFLTPAFANNCSSANWRSSSPYRISSQISYINNPLFPDHKFLQIFVSKILIKWDTVVYAGNTIWVPLTKHKFSVMLKPKIPRVHR